MITDSTNKGSFARIWASRVLTAIPILVLTFSASLKISHNADFAQKWESVMGLPENQLLPIGILELLCTAIYAIPRTRILGAIMVTAYLGGATATHVRVSDPPFMPVLLGISAWLGVYLSDPRLGSLVPLRSPR